jgi:hypothetical protein
VDILTKQVCACGDTDSLSNHKPGGSPLAEEVALSSHDDYDRPLAVERKVPLLAGSSKTKDAGLMAGREAQWPEKVRYVTV